MNIRARMPNGTSVYYDKEWGEYIVKPYKAKHTHSYHYTSQGDAMEDAKTIDSDRKHFR